MRRVLAGGFVVMAGLLLAWGAAASPSGRAAVAYADAPPPAHTGGFGEPTCAACHFGSPVNDGEGSVALGGIGGAWVPGKEYELVLRLHRPELARGGFELSARWATGGAAGRQAGVLEAGDTARSAVTVGERGILYLHHTATGSEPPAGDTVLWRVRWRAPASGLPSGDPSADAAVVFHAAANAANDDASEFGDHVYTLERRIRAAPGPEGAGSSGDGASRVPDPGG